MPASLAKYLQVLGNHFKSSADDWCHIADELQKAFDLPDDQLNSERPASRFILTWMREAKTFHREVSKLFGRVKQPPLADDFTAAIALCLERFLTAKGYPGRVRCEEKTDGKAEASRPDVSIRSSAREPVATVKCKIDFGWTRKKWEEQHQKRERALHARYPKCLTFLCVLSQDNWNSGEFLKSSFYKKKWFCLSKVPAGKLSDPLNDVCSPIEPMFFGILKRLNELEGSASMY